MNKRPFVELDKNENGIEVFSYNDDYDEYRREYIIYIPIYLIGRNIIRAAMRHWKRFNPTVYKLILQDILNDENN